MRLMSLRGLAALTALASFSAPAFAQNPSTPMAANTPNQTSPSSTQNQTTTAAHQANALNASQRHKEKTAARSAFHHLSDHGQRAMISILEAQQLLNSGNLDAAIPALTSASHHLNAAANAREKFTAAENELHPRHKINAPTHHTPITEPTDWIPVGGEFIANETLTPEKQANLAKANDKLRSGNMHEAAQIMEVVSDNIDFIIALAPLSETQGAINRALIFAQNHNIKMAQEAISDSLNNLVYVSENIVSQNLAATPQKSQVNTQQTTKAPLQK